jgi:cell wall-associated NlpC family hydrolase
MASLSPLLRPVSLTVCGALPVGSPLPDGSTFNPEQAANGSIIVTVGQQMGAGVAGEVDAVTAALTESHLANIAYGDMDSLGLFQERPSQGWGTPAQILDPVFATSQFFAHLQALPGWQSLSPTVAAQAVERSGFAGRYQQWVGPAGRLVAGLSGSGACTNGDGASRETVALPANYSLAAGTPLPIVAAVEFALAQLGKPYVWGGVGPDGYDCSGLTMQAYHAAGVLLPRTTYDQVYAGQPVFAVTQTAPGDLLFTEGSDPGPAGAPGHVGMYIGAGLVVDAPHAGAAVGLSHLSEWAAQVVAIRRPVPG